MHTAGAYQADEMYLLFILLCVIESLHNLGFSPESLFFNGFGNPYHVLVNHPAGTNIEMTNLRVPHLAIGQSHIPA